MTYIQCLVLIFGWLTGPGNEVVQYKATKEQKCRAGAYDFFGPGCAGICDPSPCVANADPEDIWGWHEGIKEPRWKRRKRERGW